MSERTTGGEESGLRPEARSAVVPARPLLLAATGALLLVAFRGLWLVRERPDADALLFLPGGLPSLAVLALSGWMILRRRGGMARRARADASHEASTGRARLRRSVAIAWAGFGSAVFAWATWTGKLDLLLPALASLVLAWAAACRGARGMRVMALPALVLLLGVALPKPLEDELVWRLQRWTAGSAAWLLERAGRDITQSGVILHDGEHTFHVIDSCSGMSGIAILTAIALIVRELLRGAGPRLWLVVAGAPALGFLLNVVRVALVASSDEPEKLAGLEGDHTPQGLAVLMVGTVLLYALGGFLARFRTDAPVDEAPTPREDPRGVRADDSGMPSSRLPTATALLAGGLALVSFIVPRIAPVPPPAPNVAIDFPRSKDGWTSSAAPHEPLFTGVLARGFHRRYQAEGGPFQAPEIVDVLIGYEDASRSDATRLFSSKALVPGPDWELESEGGDRIWTLGRPVALATASREPEGERALVLVWRPRDRGLVLEAGRALVGLERTPWRRDPPRALVRLVTYARHDGELALDRAKQRLDRFVATFRETLQSL